ncbi:MAG: PAS domain S-box protein [Chitinophagaceae bacterium]|nr:MAG: PAS domain S-box protein [Chitinophagaceae bacterium]
MSRTAAGELLSLESDGEMANIIRNRDWSLSSIGSQQFWPRSLVSSINLLLDSAFPMFLFWGRDRTSFYNDAFRKTLVQHGNHPFVPGSPAQEVWGENWDAMEPLINFVMEGQGSRLHEDQSIPVYRNGKAEQAYWTFSYNPVKNDEGMIEGVLAILYETTHKVKEKQEAEALQQQLQLALEACDLGTFDLDPQALSFSCNEKTKAIFGLSATENNPLQMAIDMIHPHDRDYVEKAIAKAFDVQGGGKYDIEYSIIQPHTINHRIVRAKGRVYFHDDGSPKRFAGTVQDITDEKLSERQRKKLQQLVENSGDFTGMARPDGQMTYINAAGRELVGLSPDFDITSLKTTAFYSEEQFQFINREVFPLLKEQKHWDGFIKIRHFQTSEEIPCHANYILITDHATGEVISRGATFRDLRSELVARKELEDSEKRFRNLVQEAPVATAIYVGREMKIQWANDAMIKLWGKDKSVIGKTIREALPELEDQPFHHQLDNVFTTGNMYQASEDPAHLIVNGKLRTFYFNFSYKPLRDTDGNIYGILNMAIDVSENVRVKRKLEESERNFRNLIMQAPVGICLLAGDDHVVEIANDEYLELVGRELEGFVGYPIWDLIPEAKSQGFDVILKGVKDTGDPFFGNEIPITLVRNGIPEAVYINFVYEPLFDETGSVHRILVIAINVTRQVEARKLVENAEERARLAIESASLGTYEVNLQTTEIHASDRLYQLFDVSPTTRQLDFVSHIDPRDQEVRQKAHDLALQTGRLGYECRIQRRDGTQNWVHVFGQFYFDENGKPVKAIGIVKDITKEKEGEQELERRVKERTEELTKLNEELQQFTYVSSHDLKEPLRKIQLFTHLIQESVSEREPKQCR